MARARHGYVNESVHSFLLAVSGKTLLSALRSPLSALRSPLSTLYSPLAHYLKFTNVFRI
jgi:hypothetical protein